MKPKTDLEKKYSEVSNECEMLLNTLKSKLKKHNKLFSEHPTNYGYLGNLGHVRQQLQNIDEFLKNI